MKEDEIIQHLSDIGFLQKTLMSALSDCCSMLDEMGSGEAHFTSGKWTVVFTPNPDRVESAQ